MKDKVTPLETKSKFLYLDFELINKKTTFLFLLVSTFFCVSVNAQSGYIYVHKKALNEKSSIDFPFTVSGGPTAVAPFSLNDGDGQLRVKDLGSSQNGRLWAIHETTNTLYYRNTNSNVWVQTSIADANRVDGDINGNAVYINTSGTVFSTDGTTTTQLSSAAAYSGTADIGSGWNGLPYVTRGGIIYQYSGAGITWNVVSDQSATYSSSAIDVDPTNPLICYVVVRNTASSTNSIIRVNAGVVTNIGAPFGMSNAASNIPRDVAVNDKAELFISAVATNWYVYKYTSSWSAAEVTSFDVSNLTGGVGGELWVTMNSGNQYFGQPTVPYYNIFTRATNGTNVYYIDDERVRTTAGNSILIPVLPGTYTITEALSTDWDLQAIRIEDPTNNSTSNHVTGTATIDVAAGEIVNVVFQNGQLNPIAMTTSCTENYLEDFGTGAVGTFGSLVPGQTSYHLLDNTVRAEDGYCKVVSTAFPDFNNWRATPFYDHTSGNGTGRMYAVNAGYDLGEFFRRRFTGVVPGLTYNFSAWVANLTPGEAIRPNIKFQIVDHITQAVIATYDTGNINTGTIQWKQYGFTFTATSSDIDLILSNNAIGGNGNDLAIDDISFSLTVPPTPTITVVNSSCPLLGSITVTSPLGATYEYSLDGVNYQTSTSFPNLSFGNYTVYVRRVGTNCVSNIATSITGVCAVNDTSATPVNGTIGGDAGINVYDNDTLNGNPATASNVTLTSTPTAQLSINPTTGAVTVTPNTPAGTYTIDYTICDKTNPGVCDTATETVTVPLDSDGDGVPDWQDLDDDNDGITDCDENLLGANASVSNVFSFVTAGTAIATSNNEVRLTQDTGYQAGRIWSVGKVDFTKSFVLRFDAYLGTRDNGADGIAAVFHNSPQGVNATGATGLGIGASGIANGIVLELDTYNNGTGLGDISSDHGQIWDSDNQTSTGFLTTAIALPELENSAWHPVVINWNATTKTISYTVDGTNAGTYTGDLVTNYFAGANKVYFGYTASTGGATNEQKIRINSFCSDLPLEMDNDNDGIPNQLDTDSDGDGCADAIEGSENVTYSQIHALDLPASDTNYAYRGQIKVKYDGVTTGSPSQIISTSAAANGVPQLLNNAGNNLNASTNPSNLAGAVDNTDGTADIGQGIGDSQDNTINSCKCYKAPSTDRNNYPTNHGITAFNRAGTDNQNWPMVRQSGWTALEASTKGFVINRMPASTTGGNAGEPVNGTGTPVITSPIAGMMFYDTTNDCLKINVDGTRSGWKCFNNQSCPDEN